MAWHMAQQFKFLNQRISWTFKTEDYVGKISKLAHGCTYGTSRMNVSSSICSKYRWYMHLMLSRGFVQWTCEKKVSFFPLTTMLVGRNCVHVYHFSNLILGCHIWMVFLFIPVLKSMLAVSWVIQVSHYREGLLVRKESMPCRRVLKVHCRRAPKEPCRRALKSPVEGKCKSNIW